MQPTEYVALKRLNIFVVALFNLWKIVFLSSMSPFRCVSVCCFVFSVGLLFTCMLLPNLGFFFPFYILISHSCTVCRRLSLSVVLYIFRLQIQTIDDYFSILVYSASCNFLGVLYDFRAFVIYINKDIGMFEMYIKSIKNDFNFHSMDT